MALSVRHCFSTTTWTSAQKILQNVGRGRMIRGRRHRTRHYRGQRINPTPRPWARVGKNGGSKKIGKTESLRYMYYSCKDDSDSDSDETRDLEDEGRLSKNVERGEEKVSRCVCGRTRLRERPERASS